MMDDDKTALKEKKNEYYQEKPSQYRTCQLTTQRPYGSLDLEFLKCFFFFLRCLTVQLLIKENFKAYSYKIFLFENDTSNKLVLVSILRPSVGGR